MHLVSNFGQTPGGADYGISMEIPIRILTAEVDDGEGIIVTFSDGTTAAYVVEELLELRPHREMIVPKVEKLS